MVVTRSGMDTLHEGDESGTGEEDEKVGMETEGFAIYDTMMLVKNEIQTVAVGAAIGQACLLLSAGTKGKRYMLPHATAMIQQPRLPSTGQMPAIDVHIRAKEVVNNRDTLATLLAKHTGNSFEKVSKVMQRPFYMDPRKAIEFGVADKDGDDFQGYRLFVGTFFDDFQVRCSA
ncbi:hypothetical protein L7F22_029757 [Adiantum nelumboides]|nr:hypothetical protein [Adiantum nelumboides]